MAEPATPPEPPTSQPTRGWNTSGDEPHPDEVAWGPRPPEAGPAAYGGSWAEESSADEPEATAAPVEQEVFRKKPICCIVLGMAGSGKTTLLQRLNLHMEEKAIPGYYVNLDPAVKQVPFAANIDIRDTVNYTEVMSQYGLGPNGGIMTSLNLFATRFDQVLGILERRADSLDYVFLDTPGQIEVFTWSASGQIISESLATAFPTVLIYVVDTPRTTNPTTFMSNMLYACSVLYKSRLPIVVTFNKADIMPPDFALEWMSDFEKFSEALSETAEESYMTNLNHSLALVLDEFYNTLRTVGLSAATGAGMDDFFKAVQEAAEEFEQDYLPDLQARREAATRQRDRAKQQQLEHLMRDISVTKGDKVVADGNLLPGCGDANRDQDLETHEV